MRIDTARTQKCLYGIKKGMTTKELIGYTGYGARTVKKIAENPEEYERKLKQAKKEEEEEWIPLWAEVFAYEWEKVTGYIKKYAGWEEKSVSKIHNDIQKEYFTKRWGDDPIANMVSAQVKQVVEDNKDLIIEKASKVLAEKISRKKGTTDAVINGAIEEIREGKGDGI